MRTPLFSRHALLFTGLVALAGLGAVGCGNAVAACDKQCDCEKCPTSLHNACIATGESDEQEALKNGCTSELDALHDCQVSTGVCNGTDYKTTCDTQAAAWKACAEPQK